MIAWDEMHSHADRSGNCVRSCAMMNNRRNDLTFKIEAIKDVEQNLVDQWKIPHVFHSIVKHDELLWIQNYCKLTTPILTLARCVWYDAYWMVGMKFVWTFMFLILFSGVFTLIFFVQLNISAIQSIGIVPQSFTCLFDCGFTYI